MKLATGTCPNCHTAYWIPVAQDAIAVQCPGCRQQNTIDPESPTITGLCHDCGLPLDDHLFAEDRVRACPGECRAA